MKATLGQLAAPELRMGVAIPPKRIQMPEAALSGTLAGAKLPVPHLANRSNVAELLTRVGRDIDTACDGTDWGDGDDYGPEFLIPTVERREAARLLVKRLARVARLQFEKRLPVPDFGPAADGSVDLHWGQGKPRELLLGVRTTGTEASFFGRDASGSTIKGLLRTEEENAFLVAWLLG